MKYNLLLSDNSLRAMGTPLETFFRQKEGMMRMNAKLMIVIFLLALPLAAPVAAQHGGMNDMDQLRATVDKTQDVIAEAKEAVSESGSERARNQLAMAIRLQNAAMEMMRSGAVFSQTFAMQVGKYTLNARSRAQRAIAITRQSEENEDYVRGRLERTDDLIRQAEEEVDNQIPPGLKVLIDSARDQQERARELFRNRRLKASLQLTLQTERSLIRAMEQQGTHVRAQKRYQAQIDRYIQLREQIEANGDADLPETVGLLKNAETFRVQAEKLADQERYGRADKIMTQAVEVLAREAERLREPAKIKAALENLTGEMERVKERVENSNASGIREEYQNARQHVKKATELYAQNNYEAAAAQIQAARQLMQRIARALGE